MGRRDERSRSRGRSRSPRRHHSAERSRRRSRSVSRSTDRSHSRRKRSFSRSSSRGRSHRRHRSRDRHSRRSSPSPNRKSRRRSRSASRGCRLRRSRSSSYSRSRQGRSPRGESRHRSPSWSKNRQRDRRSDRDSSHERSRKTSRDRGDEAPRDHHREDSRNRHHGGSRSRHHDDSRDRHRAPSHDRHREGSRDRHRDDLRDDAYRDRQRHDRESRVGESNSNVTPKTLELPSKPVLETRSMENNLPVDPRPDHRGRESGKSFESQKMTPQTQLALEQSHTQGARMHNVPSLDSSAPPSVESTPASTPISHNRPATKVTIVILEDPAAKRRRVQREEAHRTYLKSTVLRAKAEAKLDAAMAKVHLAETWLTFVDKTLEDVGRRIELQDWKFKKMDEGMSLEELLEAPTLEEPEPEHIVPQL